MLRVLLLCSVIAAATTLPALASDNDVYGRVKNYRTYLSVGKVTQYIHLFEAWVDDNDWYCGGANTEAEIGTLTRKDFLTRSGYIGLPPADLPPVPEALKPLAQALRKRINQLEAHTRRVPMVIGYRGFKRMVRVDEFIPVSDDTDPQERTAIRTSITFGQAPGRPQLDLLEWHAMGWYQMLCGSNAEGGETQPSFIDYRLPPQLEGSCLLYSRSRWGHPDETYELAWKEASGVISRTADALTAGTYNNPIESILQAQGSTALPPGFNAHVDIAVGTYGTKNGQNRELPDVRFRVSLREAMHSVVKRTVVSPESKLSYELVLDMANRKLTVVVTTPGGQSCVMDGKVDDDAHHKLIVDGDNYGIEGQYLGGVFPEGIDLSLPGNGAYEKFIVSTFNVGLLASRSFASIGAAAASSRSRLDNRHLGEVQAGRPTSRRPRNYQESQQAE
jgi:hypothetical protein